MSTLPKTTKIGSRASNFPGGSKSPLTPASITKADILTGFFSAWGTDTNNNAQIRPLSDFDAGINTSNAWTEHRHLEREASSSQPGTVGAPDAVVEHNQSLSDDEGEEEEKEARGRPARALYKFEGQIEFRELSVEAGEDIEVIKQKLDDGWSLARNAGGEVGLLPQTYYTFTSNFVSSPESEVPPPTRQRKEASTDSAVTPRGSPNAKPEALPIIPQTTGEWLASLPSFRKSLLGGKSLNRFSAFVTSGAEEWVLHGTDEDGNSEDKHTHERISSDLDLTSSENRLSRIGLGEADRHFVDAGPAWQSKVPPFRVLVHSPEKRISPLSGAYTVYSVTSIFGREGENKDDDDGTPPATPTRITVHRRFSHFVLLHTALTRRLHGIALPPLPEKQYAGRFSKDFVEARRGDLERYMSKLIRHPIARYAEIMTFFLGCESDIEWKRQLPAHLALPPAGPSFYAHVFHPAFNIDADDAEEAVDRFSKHTRSVEKGVQGLRSVFSKVREARVEMSRAERLLSYSLLALITSRPLDSSSSSMASLDEEEEEEEIEGLPISSSSSSSLSRKSGLMNSDGAWCWREGCQECLHLTKAMQKTADTLQNVADLYDDHARRTQLATHEALKIVAHPNAMYQGIIDTHKSTMSRLNEAMQRGNVDEDIAARCETVLNTTMAEMSTYHTQKVEDFKTVTKEHIDGEIALYESILERLRAARATFDRPPSSSDAVMTISSSMSLTDPRQPSMYERDLGHSNLELKLDKGPLPMPCPHVHDSAPMRPVSVAIQQGVGMLLWSGSGSAGASNGSQMGRGSVFGRFW